MTRTAWRLALPFSFALALGSTSASVLAQTETIGGYALNQHEATPAGDVFFGVPSPFAEGQLVPRGVVSFDYAHRPLRLGDAFGPGSVVGGQGTLRVGASLALFDRLLVHADMPFAVVQSGDDPDIGGITLASPSGADVGDLRLGARGSVFGRFYDPFQLGVGAYLFVPTGPSDGFTSDGAVRANPYLSLGGRFDAGVPWQWTAAGGAMLRGSDQPNALTYGVGVAALLAGDRLQVGPELYGATHLKGDVSLSTPTLTVDAPGGTNLEALIGSKVRLVDSLVFGAAAGPGITSTVGTPSFRGVLSLSWSPTPEHPVHTIEDADGDGVEDEQDACPQRAGVAHEDPRKNGCPPPDRDGDGVPDTLDACLEVPGEASAHPLLSGCPIDRDGDGVIDTADACVDEKGLRSTDPAKNGCPAPLDPDGDGVLAAADACPETPGVRTDDPATNGCPEDENRDRDGDGIANHEDACLLEAGAPHPNRDLNGCPNVHVTDAEIVIAKQIRFVFGKSGIQDTVDPVSDELLNDVLRVIREHPEIVKIEIQGHTDATGPVEINARLSQARANSVKDWLIDRGIPPGKVSAKGYGASQPIADNDTDEGRQKNRRVQFVIVAREAATTSQAAP
jgi:OOP family OmpA-OmpF porin